MSTTLIAPPTVHELQHESSADDRVRSRVWSLLAAMDPHGHRLERRTGGRYPYPYLIHITPLGASGEVPAGEPVVVVGKHLSERGFSFYHPKPLPFRRVIATLETATGARLAFVLLLTWCRFTRQGWYESGGRFLDTATSPPEGG
jgi:hypothetical protein